VLTPWDIVRIAVSILLLISAALKLHQLLTASIIGSKDWLTSPHVQWLAVGWESALALWLWSGNCPKACRWAAMATFAVFSAVSLLQALAGKRSCCCFGVVDAAPWFVFAMDVGILFYLWRIQPDVAAQQFWTPRMRTVTTALAVSCLTTGVGAAMWHRPASSALQVLDWPESPLQLSQGKTAEWKFRLRNVGNDGIRITRLTTSCECFSLRLAANHLQSGASIVGVALVQGDRALNTSGSIALTSELEFKTMSGTSRVALTRDLQLISEDSRYHSSGRRTP
jgi:hypothetical protein